jgi:hypothetical protein
MARAIAPSNIAPSKGKTGIIHKGIWVVIVRKCRKNIFYLTQKNHRGTKRYGR